MLSHVRQNWVLCSQAVFEVGGTLTAVARGIVFELSGCTILLNTMSQKCL